ncbi:MAG TPA: sodium:solute symporter [Rhizomicrobium sp.]|nr:sodium:solute symporter [Rhizomicrobium sp.]
MSALRPDATAIAIFVALFALVTVLGFAASRWRAGDLSQLHEWGLGGRRFGSWVVWFLLGGDLYTAYTFVAVPAAVMAGGALGFFAVPYTIFVFPIMFSVFPRLWSVSHAKGYVTAADFVRGRFGSRMLALAVALTGIVATMPYIALQLVGIQVVLAGLGIQGEWPLVIAFVVLALYTYSSGLRAPAMIAMVKDTLIYVTVIAAIAVIPAELGGFGRIFAAADAKTLLLAPSTAANLGAPAAYITLALGSAMALFLYPHAVTGVLSSSGRDAIRRNAVALPAYSLALGLIALFGFMALAAGVKTDPAYAAAFRTYGANFAVPALFLTMFPKWFVGVAFAAIAIGALVPAAIMSIACANLFTRNIWREFIEPGCAPARESQVARIASLAVKLGALAFILELHDQAIQLQLLGGIFIIQMLPAVLIGLYTRWLHPLALLIGWGFGVASGTWMAWTLGFAKSVFALHILGVTVPCYAALSALVLNLAVAAALSLVFNAFGRGRDETAAGDYI